MTPEENVTKSVNAKQKLSLLTPGSPSGRAALLVCILLLLCGLSLASIFLKGRSVVPALEARIYRDGTLYQTIDLTTVTEPYTIAVPAPEGGFNTIEVRPGAIGICDADCPDKLCVKMGYADSSLLPIICLPHSLVIEVVEKEGVKVDGVSY